MPLHRALLAGALFLSALIGVAASTAHGAPATFEGYSEGSQGTLFFDLQSGFTFSNPTYSLGSTVFTVEHAEGATVPPVIPGNYLTCAGFSPGNGGFIGANAGFTVTFNSTTSNALEMDVLHSTFANGVLNFTGYDVVNQQVATGSIPIVGPGGGGSMVTHVVFPSAAAMFKVTVAPTGDLSAGYDNVTIPEPGAASMLIITLAVARYRRRRGTV
jgi:hypothetical protein